jgi:hypothetical protein
MFEQIIDNIFEFLVVLQENSQEFINPAKKAKKKPRSAGGE